MPHNTKHILGDVHQSTADSPPAGVDRSGREAHEAWAALPLGGARAASSCGPPTSWPVRGGTCSMHRRCSVSRRRCYQAEIDAACELIDFWRFNVDFARDLPGPAAVGAGHVEPDRLPAARRLRVRGYALQLHVYRRQPPDRTCPDGEHGCLEAVVDAGVLGPLT